MEQRLKEILDNQLYIIQRLKVIEEKLESVGGSSSKPEEPESILTCVQCQAEYKESENGHGSCKYHTDRLTGFHRYTYGCCDANHTNYDAARKLVGCTKGKHRSEHHKDYSYSAYYKYLSTVAQNAKELWLSVEALDAVSTCYLWAEAGLTEDGNVFVLAGENRASPVAVKEVSVTALKLLALKNELVLVDCSGASGWTIKAALKVDNGQAIGIELSVKPSLVTSATTKVVSLAFQENAVTGECVEVISDLDIVPMLGEPISLPENEKIGPFLDNGVDYSKDRKNDYESFSDDGCALQAIQRGHTKVNSTYPNSDGKWINKFVADVQVTNPSEQRVAVTDILGFYLAKDDEWVACDEVLLGFELFRGSHQWDAKPNFNINERSTGNLSVSLGIRCQGNGPSDGASASRAHYSLPQPLHLKAVLKDHQGKSVVLRFEQGNPALDLPNEEKRRKDWTKDGEMLGYCFVDNVDKRQRFDAALFYGSQGMLSFRMSNQSHYIRSMLKTAAIRAKLEENKEYYMEDLSKEATAVNCKVWAMIDLDNQVAFALKVELKTATSTAVSYWRVPPEDSPKLDCLTVEPQDVLPGGNVTVKWNVPRASKSDTIYFYNKNGVVHLSGMYCKNKEGCTIGSATIKAPKVPAVYEGRYFPSWLSGSNCGFHRDHSWGRCRFTVKAF